MKFTLTRYNDEVQTEARAAVDDWGFTTGENAARKINDDGKTWPEFFERWLHENVNFPRFDSTIDEAIEHVQILRVSAHANAWKADPGAHSVSADQLQSWEDFNHRAAIAAYLADVREAATEARRAEATAAKA